MDNSVDEEKDIGMTDVDRETGQGFTPGPWVLDYNRDASRIKDAEGITLAVAYDLRRDADGTEEYANARLITAAPALYEALKRMDALVEGLWKCIPWGKTFDLDIAALNEAPLAAKRALALVDRSAAESAKRPISDRGNDGPASETK